MANGQVVTNAGRAIVSNLVSGLGGTVPKWLGWGTGTTTPVAADTALQTPSAEARTVGVPTRTTTTVANDTVTITGTITSASTQAITELGVFDALVAGNLFAHAVFSALNLVPGDGLLFVFNWVIG